MKHLEEITKRLLINDINTLPKDTVICEYTAPGTYTVDIPVDGKYEIYCIAPGGESTAYDANYYNSATE